MQIIELGDGATVAIDEHCVELGAGMWWVPHHTWDDHTDQIDARIVTTAGAVAGGCDLWAADVLRAECEPPTVAAAATAEEVWADGGVLCVSAEHLGATSLVVPGAALNGTLVHEALRRFRP